GAKIAVVRIPDFHSEVGEVAFEDESQRARFLRVKLDSNHPTPPFQPWWISGHQWYHWDPTSACSRSHSRSSASSRPIESRIISGSTPAARCSASLSCWWVVEAGWITSDLASPTLARCENSWSLSINRRPASSPPLMPKVRIAPAPLGR